MAESPRVKICGLRTAEDARAAAEAGAAYIGFVLTPGFSRSVDVRAAAEAARGLQATPVAVLVDESPARAVALARRLGAGVVQLHGGEPPEEVAEVARQGPWRVWKALRAADAGTLREGLRAYGEAADGLLVEGYRPGSVGGAGARVDPSLLGSLRDLMPSGRTLVLAGGLDPDNVADVVRLCRPDVVDVSSGVESVRGRKDPRLMHRFVRAVHAARSPTAPARPSASAAPET